MSGFELVLAIVPIAISAAEHRKLLNAGRALVSSKVKERQLYDFCLELHDELSFLENTLGSVVSGLPTRPDPDSLMPLSPDELDAINAVLGNKAPTFHSLLERILEGLNALVSDKSLSLGKPGISIQTSEPLFARLEQLKQNITKNEASSTLGERFRFTRNEKTRAWALKRIRNGNEKLERLLRGKLLQESTDIHRLKSKRTKAGRLRRFSEPLFDIMARKWPKADECHHHEARLCLWSCCSDQRHQIPGESLDLVLSVTDVENDGGPWQESVIVIPSEGNRGHAESTVKFIIDGQTLPAIPPSNSARRDIDSVSLCKLIAQAHGQQAALQVDFDCGKLWQTQTRRRSSLSRNLKDIALKDLLAGSCRRISLREKWILAVVLGHTILHCSNGPWLCQDWSKEHISFFSSDSCSEPDLGRPYLKVYFDDRSTDVEKGKDLFNAHACPSLLSLGVLLLEIYLSVPIEKRYLEEDLIDGAPNENTNLTTALRLLEDMEGHVYEGYRSAIEACLNCDMEASDSEEFRRRVYEEIVLPLEQELEHGFKLTPEMLPLAWEDKVRRFTV